MLMWIMSTFAIMNKNISTLLILLFAFAITACDNEVDLTAEYEDTTVVFGLLNVNSDTQFVKVNRAFLEKNTNAITLAKDTNQLFYSNAVVSLLDESTGFIDTLRTIRKPKEDGIFSTDKNLLFYTTRQLFPNRSYVLNIDKQSGDRTTGRTITLDSVQILKPNVVAPRQNTLSLTLNNGSSLKDEVKVELKHSNLVANFQVDLIFFYTEVSTSGRELKQIRIPLGTISNSDLKEDQVTLEFNADRFYEAIANAVDPGNRRTKEIDASRNLIFDIYAADVDFDLYRGLNGPIEGLSQVKPEYTNISNGIGLFSSRVSTFAYSRLTDDSRERIIRIDSRTSNLNFVSR